MDDITSHLALGDGLPIDCCGIPDRFNLSGDGNVLARKECYPIAIPQQDQRHQTPPRDAGCMNFVRTIVGPRIDCKPGPAEQARL